MLVVWDVLWGCGQLPECVLNLIQMMDLRELILYWRVVTLLLLQYFFRAVAIQKRFAPRIHHEHLLIFWRCPHRDQFVNHLKSFLVFDLSCGEQKVGVLLN